MPDTVHSAAAPSRAAIRVEARRLCPRAVWLVRTMRLPVFQLVTGLPPPHLGDRPAMSTVDEPGDGTVHGHSEAPYLYRPTERAPVSPSMEEITGDDASPVPSLCWW